MLFLVDWNNQENVAEAPGFQDLLIQMKPEKLVSDVLFLEVLVISCIISKKNVTFVMRSLLK